MWVATDFFPPQSQIQHPILLSSTCAAVTQPYIPRTTADPRVLANEERITLAFKGYVSRIL